MRMGSGMIMPVAEEIDRSGYRVVDLTASSFFEVLLRYCREDPFDGLDSSGRPFPTPASGRPHAATA
jgi:oxaloacetate decarboxylase alpha subunit